MVTRVIHEFESLKFSESALLKDHFCEVSLKSVGWFQWRRFFLVIVHGQTDTRTDDGH